MPMTTPEPPTRTERARATARQAEGFIYRHSPVIAAFLAGLLLGLLGQ
jgi:hypothetical protein